MANWQSFTDEAPDLAEKIRERFTAAKSHVLATLRKDGSPRVSGIEVDFHGQDLLFGSMRDAVKAQDLRRDGRFALHAFPGTESGGDAKVSGCAVELADPAEVETIRDNPGLRYLFRLDLTQAALTWLDGDTINVETWNAGEGVVRFSRSLDGSAQKETL